jgi:hypothetical protein
MTAARTLRNAGRGRCTCEGIGGRRSGVGWSRTGDSGKRCRVARCVTCGTDLDPERAERYDYCLDPDCRAKNARMLTIASVGVNKAADQYVILDEGTKQEMASGRFQDARRTSIMSRARPRRRSDRTRETATPAVTARHREEPAEPWTRSQQDLAFALHVTGRKPLHEIAERVGLRPDTVAEMIAAAERRSSR